MIEDDNGFVPFFVSSKEEANKLLPVIIKGNGGASCFKIFELKNSKIKDMFAICFSYDIWRKKHLKLPERHAGRWRHNMREYLFGYLAGESYLKNIKKRNDIKILPDILSKKILLNKKSKRKS